MAQFLFSTNTAQLSTKRRMFSSRARVNPSSSGYATNTDDTASHYRNIKVTGNRGDLPNRPKRSYDRPIVSTTSPPQNRLSSGCTLFAATRSNQPGSKQSKTGTMMIGRCSPSTTCKNTTPKQPKQPKQQRGISTKHAQTFVPPRKNLGHLKHATPQDSTARRCPMSTSKRTMYAK